MKADTSLVNVLMILTNCVFPSASQSDIFHQANLEKPIIAASQAEKNMVELSEQPTLKPPVELEFIEWRGSKPPLKYLVLDITLRNDSDENRWFILPYQLTRSPQLVDLMLSRADILELNGQGRAIIGNFQAYTGFWALLLPGHAQVKIRRFRFSFRGEDIVEKIPIEVAIASQLLIDGQPAETWLGVSMMSDERADVTQNEQHTISSKKAPNDDVVTVSLVDERRIKLQYPPN